MNIFGSTGRNSSALLTFFLSAFLFCTTFSIAGAQTALTLSILLWITLAVLRKAPRPRRTMLDVPILVFLTVWIATVFFTNRPWDNLFNMRNLLLMSIIYLFGYLVDDKKKGRRLVAVLMFSGAAASIYAISIFLLGKGRGTLGRTAGTFSNAMTFGGVMFLLCSLIFSLSVGRSFPRKMRIAIWLAAFLGMVALFFSFTRSSWLGMLVSSIVILAVLRRRLLVPFGIGLIILFLLLPANYRQRVTSIWDIHFPTNVERLELLRGGWGIFKDHPLVGIGAMDMAETYRRYKPPEAVHVYGHMHNVFLQTAVTTGIVGLVAFCFLLLSFFRLVIGNLHRNLSPPERAWVAGSLGALAGFVVNGLFDWNFGDAEVVMLLYFIIGTNLAIAIHRQEFEDEIA
jgi:O-antigen ligase